MISLKYIIIYGARSRREVVIKFTQLYMDIAKCWFPQIGVPPNHPLSWDFPLFTNDFGIPPFWETPISTHEVEKMGQELRESLRVKAAGHDGKPLY